MCINCIYNLNQKDSEMSNPVEQQPRTVEEAEQIVEIYDALERLQKNLDYQKVFNKHLFNDEVIRLNRLLGHPEKTIVDSRDRIIGDLDALSNVQFTLQMIRTIGSTTKTQLDEFREAQALDEAELKDGE